MISPPTVPPSTDAMPVSSDPENRQRVQMNWIDTFINPVGVSSPLQFTRAWTVLFFTQTLVWFGIGILLLGVATLAGAEMGPVRVAFVYGQAIIFVLTTILSVIIHIRRLNDAGRSAGWAIIALLPLIFALMQFVAGIHERSVAYDKHYEASTEYRADPAAWQEKQLKRRRGEQAERQEEQAERERQARESESGDVDNAKTQNRREQGRRGGAARNKNAVRADQPLQTKEAFVLRPNVAGLVPVIMLFSAFVMLWTLLWVARAPLNGATYAKMRLLDIMFMPQGRIGRLQFWLGWGVSITVLAGVVMIALLLRTTGSGFGTVVAGLLVLSAILFLLLSQCMISGKRLHDMGFSARCMFVPWGVSLALGIIVLIVFIFSVVVMPSSGTDGPPTSLVVASLVAGFVTLAVHVGFLSWLGLGWPEMRENRHGPPPLAGETGPQVP